MSEKQPEFTLDEIAEYVFGCATSRDWMSTIADPRSSALMNVPGHLEDERLLYEGAKGYRRAFIRFGPPHPGDVPLLGRLGRLWSGVYRLAKMLALTGYIVSEQWSDNLTPLLQWAWLRGYNARDKQAHEHTARDLEAPR